MMCESEQNNWCAVVSVSSQKRKLLPVTSHGPVHKLRRNIERHFKTRRNEHCQIVCFPCSIYQKLWNSACGKYPTLGPHQQKQLWSYTEPETTTCEHFRLVDYGNLLYWCTKLWLYMLDTFRVHWHWRQLLWLDIGAHWFCASWPVSNFLQFFTCSNT